MSSSRPSSLAPWTRACATTSRTPCGWSRRSGSTLSDGTRLAARLWLPEGAGPVPAILEYLPYRLSDGTQAGDHQQMGWFAGHGYACARVDIRGTGNSDGIIEDEYSEQEQLDGLEVIAWLAEQPWCDGKVGMVGTSWSGFNGLQLAARTPPALGAVISYLRERRPLRRRRALPRRARAPHGHGAVGELHALVERAAARSGDRRRRLARAVARAPRAHAALRRAVARPPAARRLLAPRLGLRELRRHPLSGDGDRRLDRRLHRRRRSACSSILDVPRRGLVGPWGHNDPVHGVPGARRRLARRVRALLRPLAQGHPTTASTTSRC